ncbi:MAG: hypothetical protein RE471_02895 [Ferroplasma sp.]|uniref:hypothetical protein n=1 Tax=Ferroplasma sp. TaxID=2591003 RepID=UPI0028169EAE|nr:hypothetical protein [Ferroplasma sp.]WMT51834.1 MAG: hypothetical protein RE471_02895 [Ferroplasma sp.]
MISAYDVDEKYKKFYDRLNKDLDGMADALVYLIEDMDDNEIYDFKSELRQKYNELKEEGEL